MTAVTARPRTSFRAQRFRGRTRRHRHGVHQDRARYRGRLSPVATPFRSRAREGRSEGRPFSLRLLRASASPRRRRCRPRAAGRGRTRRTSRARRARRRASISASGPSKRSSSWIWRTSLVCEPVVGQSARWQRTIASLMMSAAVPWITVLTASRSPSERRCALTGAELRELRGGGPSASSRSPRARRARSSRR